MRLFLGLVGLLGLFTCAILFQRRTVLASMTPSDVREIQSLTTPVRDGPNWVRVVIGNPSESPPFPDGERLRETPKASTTVSPKHSKAPTEAAAPSRASEPRSFRLVVQRGQTLSEICRGHYGTARKGLVEAIARHNRIERIEQVREGQTLELPPLEQLNER